MNSARIRSTVLLCLGGVLFAGCEKSREPAPPAPPTTTPASEPSGDSAPAPSTAHPATTSPTPADAGDAPGADIVDLTGLTMTVPEGWLAAPVAGGMFAASEAKAFMIPGVAGDTEGCTVKVTHFPMMKGKDDINIDRWLGQVRQPDGSATSREQAKITVTELGHVRITVVDATGSLSQGMGTEGTSQAGQRLIAAIVDHPDGPHFIKASGSIESMKQAESSIDAFLKSAKTK